MSFMIEAISWPAAYHDAVCGEVKCIAVGCDNDEVYWYEYIIVKTSQVFRTEVSNTKEAYEQELKKPSLVIRLPASYNDEELGQIKCIGREKDDKKDYVYRFRVLKTGLEFFSYIDNTEIAWKSYLRLTED